MRAKVVQALAYTGPFYQAASRVREVLDADLAAVATIHAAGLIVRAVAGSDDRDGLAGDLAAKLANWGPIVVDDARLISVPAMIGNRVVGILIGYSERPGCFTDRHLENLTAYSHEAAVILDRKDAMGQAESESLLSRSEFLHMSRLATVGEMATCFSHEVSNPLTMIRGHIRLLADAAPDTALGAAMDESTWRENVAGIERASARIEEMARRMLNFGRYRDCVVEKCGMRDIVDEAFRFVDPYLRANRIRVEKDYRGDLQLVMDRFQMVQVFVNLLQNAADATAGSSQRLVSVIAREAGGRIQVSVIDTGHGISPSDIDRVFKPFFTTKGERGTGLGLFIGRRIVEDHGGTLNVQSGTNGTVFSMCLPA